MGLPEIRRLKQLEDENRKLKRLVADLTLDKTMLQEVIRRKRHLFCSAAGQPGRANGLGEGIRAELGNAPVALAPVLLLKSARTGFHWPFSAPR